MTIAYTWNIDQLECSPQLDGKNDVVITVHWRFSATDHIYNATMYGSLSLPMQSGQPFTPYEQLVESQVIGWVQDALGEQSIGGMEKSLLKQIQDQKDPPLVRKPLPWMVTDKPIPPALAEASNTSATP